MSTHSSVFRARAFGWILPLAGVLGACSAGADEPEQRGRKAAAPDGSSTGAAGDGAMPSVQGLDSNDADGDCLSDVQEGSSDPDADGLSNSQDDDSDADGIADRDEAGDCDAATAPLDSDGDHRADFQDADSDGDGLGDADEAAIGTNPRVADSDGDGVTDLVEVEGCSGDPACAADPTDPAASPRTRGDFVFLEPYAKPPSPTRDTLDFATNLQEADLYFLVDTTLTMGPAIGSLRDGLSTPGTGLIDRVRAAIPGIWVGIGEFRDYPVGFYGFPGDYVYRNLQDATADAKLAQAAATSMTASAGGDFSEGYVAALSAMATGGGLPGHSGMTPGPRAACPDAAASIGFPCFRTGAVPIVVVITDIAAHNGPGGFDPYDDALLGGHAPTYDETIDALRGIGARVIGVGQGPGGMSTLSQLALDTGAVDGSGNPLVSAWQSGSPLGDVVVDQIETLASSTPMDISVDFRDDAADAVDSGTAFVDHLEANEKGDPARGCAARTAIDTNGDGFADTFPAVTPGDRVCFDIIVKQNDVVQPTGDPQLYRATLEVRGDSVTTLDSRDVYFLVPPELEITPRPQ